MTDKEFRDDSLSQILAALEKELIRTIEKSFSETKTNPTRVEEMKEYLERVLEFAKGENKEYAAFLDNKIKNTKVNFKTENDLEWGNAKFSILIKNNNFPIKSEYTYGKDKKTVEKLINEAKKVLEYAKELNPEFFELLKSDLLNHDLISLENNWHSINALAYHSLVVKENEGIDLTIDQLMTGPYANTYIYTVVGFPTDENLERYMEALLESSAISKLITPSNIDYNMHARAILENMGPEFKYVFSEECEENPNKKKKL